MATTLDNDYNSKVSAPSDLTFHNELRAGGEQGQKQTVVLAPVPEK